MIVSVLGPRVCDLWGNNFEKKEWVKLRQVIKQQIKELGCNELLTSAKYGIEMFTAEDIIELKNEGNRIKLTLVVPCLGYGSVWTSDIRDRYKEIRECADWVTLLYNVQCCKWIEAERERYLIEHSDVLLFVVGNTEYSDMHDSIMQARKLEKCVIRIKASDIEASVSKVRC